MNMNMDWPLVTLFAVIVVCITFIVFHILRALVLKRDIEIARRYIKAAVKQVRSYQFSASELYDELDKLK